MPSTATGRKLRKLRSARPRLREQYSLMWPLPARTMVAEGPVGGTPGPAAAF